MPKLSSAETVRYYARLGAEARVRELESQIAEILAVLPDIAATESLSRGRSLAASTPTRRKRQPTSAAARKAIGDAERRRWAKQRVAAKNT